LNTNPHPHEIKIRLVLASIIGAAVLVVLTLVWLTQSTAVKANSTDFALALGKYPTISGSAIGSCSLCHTGSVPALNPYGAAYKTAGRNVAAFAVIENLDSDGDGFTNIVEINAHTFPGDPNSHPAVATTVPTNTVPAPIVPTATSTKPVVPTNTLPVGIGPAATRTNIPIKSLTPVATGVGSSPKPTKTQRPTEVEPAEAGHTPEATEVEKTRQATEQEHNRTTTAQPKPTEKPEETEAPRMSRTPEPTMVCLTTTPGSGKDSEGKNDKTNNRACSHDGHADGSQKGASTGFFTTVWSGIVHMFGGTY
jgi:hypothetical protein